MVKRHTAMLRWRPWRDVKPMCIGSGCVSFVFSKSFSCNCVLNYLYAGLEGKKTGEFNGPATFGEIAYQLLNQTLVYLTIS